MAMEVITCRQDATNIYVYKYIYIYIYIYILYIKHLCRSDL